MKYFILLSFFTIYFLNAHCQLPPESDPHRGMYIDRFVKTFVNNSNKVDPAFSILSVDTNSDGVFEREDAYLNYACENHITYINLYDMRRILGTGLTAWNENTAQFESLEKHLCRFIQKAKYEYGITQVGAIGGAPEFYDSLANYMERYKYDSTSCECWADFDVVNEENEFWGDCSGKFPEFISIMDAMYDFKQNYNTIHPENPVFTEAYIALINNCLNPGVPATCQILDGCRNCSPFAGCSNPHPRKVDRILYSILVRTPVWLTFFDIDVFENAQTEDSTDLHPLFYSEGYRTGGSSDLLGPWLSEAPVNNIFIAEDYFYYFWRNYSTSAFGQPRMNNIQPGGAHWFAASHMVGFLDNPLMVQVFQPYCTQNDSAKIDFRYFGPDEAGTDYRFWVTNDSSNSTVYPLTGGVFAGVSQWTAFNSGQRTINFSDTSFFPELYLGKGNYTAHLELNYDHSRGCSYSCIFKFVVDDRARIQVAGDTAFCHGGQTFLTASTGGSSYSWFRNGRIIPGNNTFRLKVTESGEYYCSVSGGACSSVSDTIRITVHPLPNAEVNATCNANGTITLKTNLLPANPSSVATTGPGGVTYRWNTGAETDQITVSNSPATYRVNIDNPYSGCSLYRQISIYDSLTTNFSAVITVNQQPSSPCSNDGIITASLSPPAGQYEPVRVLWSNGSNDTTLYNLPPGVYSVEITYRQGACSVYSTITLGTPPSNAPSLNEVITPASCNNSADGSIVLNPTGGNPPFKFSWDFIPDENGFSSSSMDQHNLFPGIYSLTIEDSSGCEYSSTFVVGESTGRINVSSASVTPVTGCGNSANGSATVNVTGGPGPYTIVWSDINGQTFTSGNNLHPGSYRVIATDNSGCTGFNFIHVPAEQIRLTAELLDSSITFAGCDSAANGKLFFCIHGGTKPYLVSSTWTTSLPVYALDSLGAGYYPFSITDSMNCNLTDSFYVFGSGLQLNVNTNHTTCIGCNNGSILVNTSGGLQPTYLEWEPDSVGNLNGNLIENLPAGSYQICITDSALCQKCIQTFILDDPLQSTAYYSDFRYSLAPVPAAQTLSLRIEEKSANKYNMEICDLMGRKLIEQYVFPLVENKIEIDQLTNGTYLIILRDESNIRLSVMRIVVFR